MFVWRLARKKYIHDLSGEGARLYGGRWHHKGTAILYTSEHCSLALLELLANTSKELLPNDLSYLKFFIPDEVEVSTIEVSSLPDNWKTYPTHYQLADIGSSWCKKEQTLILKVPSVIVPHEYNMLLNPRHPLFEKIETVDTAAFDVDFRLEK